MRSASATSSSRWARVSFPKGFEGEGGSRRGLGERPQAGEHPVDEERQVGGVDLPVAAPVGLVHDAGAVGVRQEQIVELGEQPGRRRECVLVGPGRVGRVEELDAVLVAERHEAGPQPLRRPPWCG